MILLDGRGETIQSAHPLAGFADIAYFQDAPRRLAENIERVAHAARLARARNQVLVVDDGAYKGRWIDPWAGTAAQARENITRVAALCAAAKDEGAAVAVYNALPTCSSGPFGRSTFLRERFVGSWEQWRDVTRFAQSHLVDVVDYVMPSLYWPYPDRSADAKKHIEAVIELSRFVVNGVKPIVPFVSPRVAGKTAPLATDTARVIADTVTATADGAAVFVGDFAGWNAADAEFANLLTP